MNSSSENMTFVGKSIPRKEGRQKVTGAALYVDLSFTDSDDPISKLKPLKVTTALFGTLDDYYPESVKILKNLK